MAQKTREKESITTVSIYPWCALWVHWKRTSLKFFCLPYKGKKMMRVFFKSFVYALLPKEQQLAVLPPRHISDLGMQTQCDDSCPQPVKHPSAFSSSYSVPLAGVARRLGNTRAVLWLPLSCISSLTLGVSVLSVSSLLPSAINDFLPIYL